MSIPMDFVLVDGILTLSSFGNASFISLSKVKKLKLIEGIEISQTLFVFRLIIRIAAKRNKAMLERVRRLARPFQGI